MWSTLDVYIYRQEEGITDFNVIQRIKDKERVVRYRIEDVTVMLDDLTARARGDVDDPKFPDYKSPVVILGRHGLIGPFGILGAYDSYGVLREETQFIDTNMEPSDYLTTDFNHPERYEAIYAMELVSISEPRPINQEKT